MFFRLGMTEEKKKLVVPIIIDPKKVSLSEDELSIIEDIWDCCNDRPLKKNKVYYARDENLDRRAYQFAHEVKVVSINPLKIQAYQQQYIYFLFQQSYQKKRYEKDKLYRFTCDRYQKTPIVFMSFSHDIIYRYCYSLGKYTGEGRFEVISNGGALGKGTFGEVTPIDATLAPDEDNGILCKVKPEGKRRVVKREKINGQAAWSNVLREFHTSIMTPHMHAKEPVLVGEESFSVIRRMEGETLLAILKKDLSGKCVLTAEQRINVSIAVLKALEEQVHAGKLIHRDIKPNNIIIEMHPDRVEAKIIDYGLAETIYDNTDVAQIGDFPYISPEVRPVLLCITTPKADVYSLARVVAEIFRATHMNEMNRDTRGFASILLNEGEDGFFLGDIFAGITDISDDIKDRIRKVIIGMGHFNPEKRWSINEAVREFDCILKYDLKKSGSRFFSLC